MITSVSTIYDPSYLTLCPIISSLIISNWYQWFTIDDQFCLIMEPRGYTFPIKLHTRIIVSFRCDTDSSNEEGFAITSATFCFRRGRLLTILYLQQWLRFGSIRSHRQHWFLLLCRLLLLLMVLLLHWLLILLLVLQVMFLLMLYNNVSLLLLNKEGFAIVSATFCFERAWYWYILRRLLLLLLLMSSTGRALLLLLLWGGFCYYMFLHHLQLLLLFLPRCYYC